MIDRRKFRTNFRQNGQMKSRDGKSQRREEKRRRKEIKEATLVGYFSNYLNILLSMLKGTNQWKKIVVVGRYVRFTMNNSSTFKDFYPLHPSLCLTITAWGSIGDAPTQRAEPSRDHAWVSTWGPTLVGMLPVAVMAYMADMATKNRNMSSGTSSIYNSDIHRLTQWFLGHVFHYPQTKGLFLYEQIQHRQKNIPAPCAVVFCPRARREIGWSPWRNFCWTLIPSFARCTCPLPQLRAGSPGVPGAIGQGPHSKLVLEKICKTWVKYLEISRVFGKRRWFCWFFGFILLSQEKWQQTGANSQTLKNFLEMFHSQLMQ